MATPAQQAANAANAQRSTGPRTAEGKACSAQNARTHGLTTRDLVVADGEREEFEQFQSSLLDEIRPAGELEATVFHQLVHAAWNLRRIRRLESELWQNEPNPLATDESSKPFDRLARYHARTERSYYRALKELKDLQTNRELREGVEDEVSQAFPEEEFRLPALVRIPVLTKQSQIHDARRQEEDVRSKLRLIDLEADLLMTKARSANLSPIA